MKIYLNQLLALCVFHPNVWDSAAFSVQTPKARPGSSLESSRGSKADWFETTDGSLKTGGAVSPKTGSKRTTGFASSSMQKTQSAFQTAANINEAKDVEVNATPIVVQGGSLRTWSFMSPSVERVQVILNSEGRPMDADIELWQGPDNTPNKVRMYSEDGNRRPFSAVIATPRAPNTVSIRNIGQMEFPFGAFVSATINGSGSSGPLTIPETANYGPQRVIQGGALKTYAFEPSVDSVQVLLETDGRPLNARIELLQGPNNNKQVIEVYTEDGMDRPFYIVIETPGSGNVVRVVNTSTMEFPLNAMVEPYSYGTYNEFEPMLGGDDATGPFGQW